MDAGFTTGDFMIEQLKTIELFSDATDFQELSGGLTNTVVKISTPTKDYVARISRAELSLLGINRDYEHEITKIASELGVGPEVRGYYPEESTLVIDFIDGQTFNDQDLKENLSKIISRCKLFHAGPHLPTDFDVFTVFDKYLDLALENDYELPQGFRDYLPALTQLKEKMRENPAPLVPCHNDLLAANFIKDEDRIWIVDYEYAGNNDPAFELGNMWVEARLDLNTLKEIVALYYGECTPSSFARTWLMAMASQYFWALYASIQKAVTQGNFDFELWGLERFEIVKKNFGSDFFQEQLAAI
jgi:thiamine kinase-like enzyme